MSSRIRAAVQQQEILLARSLILRNHSRKSYPAFLGKAVITPTSPVATPPQPESKVHMLSTFGFNPKPRFRPFRQRHAALS